MVDTRRYENASNNESATNPEADKWANMDVKGWNTPQAEEGPDEDAQEESAGNLSEDAQETEDNHEQELTPAETFEQTLAQLYEHFNETDSEAFSEEAQNYLASILEYGDEDFKQLSSAELSGVLAYAMLQEGKDRIRSGQYPLDISVLIGDGGGSKIFAPLSEAVVSVPGFEDAQTVKVGDLIALGETINDLKIGASGELANNPKKLEAKKQHAINALNPIFDYSGAQAFAETRAANLESGVPEKAANEQSFDQVLINYLQQEFEPSETNSESSLNVAQRIPANIRQLRRSAALEHLYAKYGTEDGDSEVTGFLDRLVMDNHQDVFMLEHSDLFEDKMADYISHSIDVLQEENSTDEEKQAAKKSIDAFIEKWQPIIEAGLNSGDEAERERATELLSVSGSCMRWSINSTAIDRNISNPSFRDGIIKSFERTGGLDAKNLSDSDYRLIGFLAESGLKSESPDVHKWAIDALEKSSNSPLDQYKDRPGVIAKYCCAKAIEQIVLGDGANDELTLQYLQTIKSMNSYDASLGEQSRVLMETCLENRRFDLFPNFAGIFEQGGDVLLQYLGQENEKGSLTKEQLGLLCKIPRSSEIEVSQIQLSRRAIAESGDFEYMLAHSGEFNDGDFVRAFESQSDGGKDQDALLGVLRKCYGERSDDELLGIYSSKKEQAADAIRTQSLEGGGSRADYGLMDFADAVLASREKGERDVLCGIELQRRFGFDFKQIEPLLSPEEKTRLQEAMELTKREGELAGQLKQMRESSSTELRKFAPFVLERAMIAEVEDTTGATTAEKYLDDISRFFENPNMPTYQKLARAAIYFDISKGGRDIQKEGTPTLRVSTRYEQARIISADLMRTAMRSGNRGLKEFLIDICSAEKSLSDGADPLAEFASDDPRQKMFETAGRMQMEATLATGHDLSRPLDILKEMEKVRSERDAHNRAQVIEDPNNKGHFILEDFNAEDYVKGGSDRYLDTQMQNGFVSPEMLGAFSKQDATHWDADTATGSEALKAMQAERGGGVTSQELLANTSAEVGSAIVMILRKDERFVETGDDDTVHKPGVYEMYKRMSGYENFRGCRTGYGAMDVDAFAIDGARQDLTRLSFEVTKNGCYIPIIDKATGEVLFTPEDFDREREKFSGLTEYGTLSFENGDVVSDMAEYHFSDKLDIPASLTEGLNPDISFDALMSGFEDKKAETARVHEVLKADIVDAVLQSDLFDDDFKQRFASMGDSLSNSNPGTINVFSTGSTGRDANVPHDGDYDLMFTMDESDVKVNMSKLAELLGKRYEATVVKQDGIRSGKMEVQLPDGSTQEIDIDISITKKIDRMHASTDMVLARRYDAMAGSPEEQKKVIANVIIAKALMKKAGCYKKIQSEGSDPEKGGIGGIGVENWILQNHGSLYEAAKSFVEASDKAGYGTSDDQETAFTKFKQRYAIFDIGQNFHNISHKPSFNDYPYDNMITSSSGHGPNFLVGGWEAMYGVCQKVIAAYENQSAES